MSNQTIPIPPATQKPLAVVPPDVMDAARVVAAWIGATYGERVIVNGEEMEHPDAPSSGLVMEPHASGGAVLCIEGYGGNVAVLGRWK